MSKLALYRAEIWKELPYVDVRPYSHNIISLCLRQIANRYGKRSANKVIRDFKLYKLGWRTE